MKTLLIAEDEPDIMILLRLVLEKHFAIIEASNGEETLELARDHHPDLVLMNVLMPKMDGIEVTKRLKEMELTKDIPIVLISSLSSPADIQAGLDAGAVDYIIKPFYVFELHARLIKTLEEERHGEKCR